MNLHAPQSEEAAVELEEIASIPQNIVTPRHAKPLIGVFQDTLVGSYRLTRPGIEFNRREFMNLMMTNKRFDGEIPQPAASNNTRYTGQQVLSQLLPPINMGMGNNSFNSDKEDKTSNNFVKIVQGNIEQGIVDSSIYMKPGKGIIHVTYNDYGPKQTVDLLDSLQTTVENFLVMNGFSIGISDLVADEDTKVKIQEAIQLRKKQVEQVILQVHTDLFDNNTGKTNQQEFEDQVFGILNQAASDAGKSAQGSLSDENRLVAMVKSGSKGEVINIAQMIACLGQTALEGKRIPYGYTDRTLPHFKKYDDSAEARGFVESSFIRGLTPQEFYFHAMSGREGLIDTAVKSVTGDTPVIVIENGMPKYVPIGDWIDAHLKDAQPADVEHYTVNNLELLELSTNVHIPTVDEDGNVTWGKVSAVTRHDPGETLYDVTTQSGRNVIVTAAKSLLIWDKATNKLAEKYTPDIKVGDYMPVTNRLPIPQSCNKLQDTSVMSVMLNLLGCNNVEIEEYIKNTPMPLLPSEGYIYNMLKARINNSSNGINDIILDKIVSIREIDVRKGTPGFEKYPKMYDLTIPSTFNFGLANGLQVRDTAETGYIQRQLIKAMEDIVVQHDGTVRDAKMNVVQYYYGEDSIMATKLEGQSLPLSKLSHAEIKREFGMEAVDWATVLEDGTSRDDDSALIQAYVEDVITDQAMMVEGVYQGAALDADSVNAPVNLARMILNITTRFGIKKTEKTNLTPAYVLEGINKIVEHTRSGHNKIWKALLRYHLAPHRLIVDQRMTKVAFDMLCELIVVNHMKSWVQPGEQVGVVAAQSIGEPATQMSSVGSTVICITDGAGERFYGSIKDFIDPILAKNSDKVTQIAEDSMVFTPEKAYYIVGVSEDEKTSWRKISEISRHPANGGLVEVVTRSGRKTTATLSHSFLKRSPTGIVPVLGSDLKVGMRIPIARVIPTVPGALTSITQGATTFALTKAFGWVCGIYLADGCMRGNIVSICKIHPTVEDRLALFTNQYGFEFKIRNYNGEFGPGKDNNIYSKDLKDLLISGFKEGSYIKEVAPFVFHSNAEFIAGVISGYFDGDGNVNIDRQQIRTGSRSKKLIDQMAALLGYCGIFGVVGEETTKHMPDKVMYTLNVLKKFAKQFKRTIGFNLQEKAAALDAVIEYMERDDKHNTQEMFDKIPELGHIIAETGKLLRMPGQSRTYGRWTKKESVGRLTLQQYISDFEEMIAVHVDEDIKAIIMNNMRILKSAANADVIWDEIVELNYKPDPKEYVYDFTVPGNDSFMVDNNVLVHNTLNTFHQAGVASKSAVTRGVPRLRELLKITKNPKATSLTIYLKPEYRQNKEKAREVVQDLELTLLRNITDKVAIYWDPTDEASVVDEDRKLIEFYRMLEMTESEDASVDLMSKWILRLELNREEMFNKNISMADVAFVIKNIYSDTQIVYNDYNSDNLVMRIRLPKEKDSSTASELDDFTVLKKFQNKLLNNTVIRGIPGIKAVTFRMDKQRVHMVDKKYEPLEQYILDTDGSNFVKVANHPAIDATRLYTTNVHDVMDILGLEAVRAILMSELNALFDAVGVNYRHLGILCDWMTRTGRLMSADRYGINKNDIGPIAKMSFEETERITLKASLFGEVDPVTGVSANVMTGQPFRGGTAFSQILLDEAALKTLYEQVPEDEDAEGEDEQDGDISELISESIQAADPCATAQFQMNMSMPSTVNKLIEPDVEIDIIEEQDEE